MVNLKNRSAKKELLDNDHIPFVDIKQNMVELNTVNTLLGGHKITLKGIEKLLPTLKKNSPVLICEIGCGGGDNLKAILNYCSTKKIQVKFIGIDIKQECIDFAQQQYPDMDATWVCSDYALVDFGNQYPDIIFSSLFCHHFTNEALKMQLLWMRKNCSAGFFINDLHRNYIAYYAIKFITAIFSRSYLVKNDAPLSVARGFKRQDWIAIFSAAGITNYFIEWKWAFRHLIIYQNA